MKNHKLLVPIVLVMMLFLSYYTLYSSRTEIVREYEQYLSAARNYADQGIAVDAIQNYVSALAVKDSFEVNLEVGEFYARIGDVNAAITWGEALIVKYPETAKGYEFLLNLYKNNTQYEQCFKLYSTIQKRNIVSKNITKMLREIKYYYYLDQDFEDVTVYSNGYCAVQTGGKWGFANEKGSKVIPCQFMAVGPFLGDVAPVKTMEGETYFIDKEGNKKLVPQGIDNIVELSAMYDGKFSVYDGRHWTYYSGDYKKISEAYDSTTIIANGVAAVGENGYFHLIDTENKKINDKKYVDVVVDEKGVVYRNGVLFVKTENTYYMIDIEGNRIGKEEFKNAKLFGDETYAAVEGEKGWYFIDNTGKQVFKDKYFQDARSFVNGYAAVKQDGYWGFIDMEGNIVIECTFDDAKDFNGSGSVLIKQEDAWRLLKLYSGNYDI